MHFPVVCTVPNHVGCQPICSLTVADPRGHPGAPAPYGPKFSQFHAVCQKIWQNHMLAPPGGLAPPPTGILDPPLVNLVELSSFQWQLLYQCSWACIVCVLGNSAVCLDGMQGYYSCMYTLGRIHCFYRPQRSWAKVIFSQASVCPQGGRGVCLSACWDMPQTPTPQEQTPRSRHTLPGADDPREQTPAPPGSRL